MKSVMRYLMVALAAMLLMAPTAMAGQREGAFTLSPMVGYHVFEGDQRTDDAVSYGLALGYNLTKNWGFELDLRYTPTETDFDTLGVEDEDVEVWTGSFNALYHFNPDGPFVPYLVAGFGGMIFEVDNVGGRDDDEDFLLNAGAGIKYFFSDDLALRLDARYVADLHSDRDFDQAPGSDDPDHNLIATAGLVWQFGGPPPAPAPPADSDMDGVPDIRDKCPGTPLGTAVDAVGCPPAPPKPAPVVEKPAPAPPPLPAPAPIDGDDDGDGVPNSRDKCPGTEKGVIVDEFGCPVKFTLYVEFDFDKSEIRPQYHDKLKEAADFINKYPDTKFLLAGHTDSIGTDKYNKGLSERRAAAVKKYLVEKFGIGAHLLYPRGYGESRPIADNTTNEGRQQNRRVEVICCVVIPAE